jgi:hypothetical protein
MMGASSMSSCEWSYEDGSGIFFMSVVVAVGQSSSVHGKVVVEATEDATDEEEEEEEEEVDSDDDAAVDGPVVVMLGVVTFQSSSQAEVVDTRDVCVFVVGTEVDVIN